MKYRIEKDSLGEVKVPSTALWGAQTQRALDNFQISGIKFAFPFGRSFIEALGIIKHAAASTNATLKLLPSSKARLVKFAAKEIIDGKHDNQFPLDIFQTGSGTSTNMNANEVIATIASKKGKTSVHPNDDVNMSQSSNDVIPTAIHISALLDGSNFNAVLELAAACLIMPNASIKDLPKGNANLIPLIWKLSNALCV